MREREAFALEKSPEIPCDEAVRGDYPPLS